MNIELKAADVHTILRGIFSVLKEFIESKNIQARALQLLQEVFEQHVSSPTATSNNVFIDASRLVILQTTLNRFIPHADIVSGCLHVLSTLSANEKFCDVTLLNSDDILSIVIQSMDDHGHSKKVQLRGMTLFLHLLEHYDADYIVMDENILQRAVDRVCFNLRFNDDDSNLVRICCRALDVLVRKLARHLIAPLVDDLLLLLLGVFDTQYTSGNVDIPSICLIIADELTVDEASLQHFFSNSELLINIFEIIVSISGTDIDRKRQGNSVIAAFHLLNRVIMDPQVLSVVLQRNESILDNNDTNSTMRRLYTRAQDHIGYDVFEYTQQFELSTSQANKLIVLVERLLEEMRCILGIQVNTDSVKDAEATIDQTMTDRDNDDVEEGDNGVTDNAEGDNSNRTEATKNIETHSADSDNNAVLQRIEPDALSIKRDETVPGVANHSNIIQVAAVSQQQAAVTLVRAEIMHRLFIDATQKIENLILREQDLQNQVATLSTQQLIEDVPSSSGETNAAVEMKDDIENAVECLKENDDYEVNGLRVLEDTETITASFKEKEELLTSGNNEKARYQRPSGAIGDRLWLAVAGIIEALTIITLTAETGSKYGFVSTFENKKNKVSRRALLQYGDKSILKPAQRAKYEPVNVDLGGVYYAVGSEAVSTDKMDALAVRAVSVFLHVKDGSARFNGGSGRSKHSVLSMTLFRTVLKNMSVFLMRDVDIVFSRLAVPSVSIFGFCFALMLCTQKLEKSWSCADDLVVRLTDVLATALGAPTKCLLSGSSGGSPSLQLENTHFVAAGGGRGSPVSAGGYPIEDLLTAGEMSSLIENVNGGDKKALSYIFAAYSTSSARGGLGETWSGNHGVSFEGISKFAQDFDVFPSILVHSQLFQIFGDVVANLYHYAGTSSSFSEYDDVDLNTKQRRAHHKPSLAGGEPLLTFRQFQVVIVLIALRSNYFRDAVEALTNLDRLMTAASPQRGTLVQNISPSSIKGANVAFSLAIERINRLIKWLNSSRGKERLGARARSMTSPGLTLRTMSARITSTLDIQNININ